VSLIPALVIAAVALTGSGPAATTSANAPTAALPPLSACPGQTELGASAGAQAHAMRCLVNATRRSAGLGALRNAWRLDRAALLRARAIRRCRQFSHTPCGQSFSGLFVRVGYLGRNGTVGENLAWGEAPLGTARDALVDWLQSPEHRSNLLWRGWRDVGAAEVKAQGLFGADQVSIWVVQFGRRSA
jgi:uncharacterized protein YkwD